MRQPILVVLSALVCSSASAQTAEVILTEPYLVEVVGVAVSPDKNTAYVADFNQGQIFSFPTVGGVPVSISDPGNVRHLATSADGETLYVAGGARRDIFSIPTSGGAKTVLYSGAPLLFPHGLALSPDGTTLYIADASGYKVYSLVISSGVLTELAHMGPLRPFDVAPSPDGTTLYVASPGGLFSLPASGGNYSLLTPDFAYPGSVDISPGGDALIVYECAAAISAGESGIFRLPIGGSPVPIYTGYPFDDCGAVRVSSDGSSILATNNRGSGPRVIRIDLAPKLSCSGFEPPLASGPVTVKGNRALPFKAQLYDGEGYLMTDINLVAPPVTQVWYEYGTPDADDVTDEALPAGQSSEGNQFFFDSDQRWHYNLETNDYSAVGTYTVFMDSGDDSEYVVDPTCIGQFVVN